MLKKSFIFLVAFMFVVPAFADLESRVETLERDVMSIKYRLDNRDGDNGQRGQGVTSSVDMSCVQVMKTNYPYSPNLEVLVKWANNCRANVNEEHCNKIQTHGDGECVQKLISYYPYSPNNDVLAMFARTCQVRKYICGTCK